MNTAYVRTVDYIVKIGEGGQGTEKGTGTGTSGKLKTNRCARLPLTSDH